MISAMNRLGTCASYKSVTSSRGLLASYAIKASSDGETPLPTTFTEDDWIMGGMDNADYNDRSSLSGKESQHYAAMVLFQDSTEKPPLKKKHLFLALD